MIDYDREHIWHPYTSMTSPLCTYPVVSAQGVRLRLEDGRELIDGMSSWWCAIHGYNHPVLNAAVETQLESVAHVMFGGLTHEPAVELAEKLIDLTCDPLQHVFFSDSGSVSVEVAIKMALQYWFNTGEPGKSRLLAIRGGYHGDTFGAMAVSDPVTGMHTMFEHVLPQHLFAARPESRFGKPASEKDVNGIRSLFEQHHGEIAAIILEPIVQGAGGMWFYSAEYLTAISEMCREFNVLMILDEIATGFGRTGKLFGYEHAEVTPDILCLGKAMTGGYLSMAATLTTEKVSSGISANDGALMHGPTFMGNPLAAAVAAASIDLLMDGLWQQRVAAIEEQMRAELNAYKDHPMVRDVRVLGAIGVVETHEAVPVSKLQNQFVKHGVWIRPFGNLIYLMPPYVLESADLTRLTAAIGPALTLSFDS